MAKLNRVKSLLVTTALVASSLFLASCGDSKPTAQTEQQPAATQAATESTGLRTSIDQYILEPAGQELAEVQEVTFNIQGNPSTLDPNLAGDNQSNSVIKNLFDTLFQEDVHGKTVPVGAESYEVSADGLTYTIKLRKEATWSDGKPVTAHDYIYSWQRLTDPNTASEYGSFLELGNIVNADKVLAGELPPSALGAKALDDYTIEVKVTVPTPWLIQILSYASTSPVRQDIVEKFGEQWTRPENIVTNGAFTLSKFLLNDHLEMVKNPNYYAADKVILNKVQLIFLSDEMSAWYKYLAGEIASTTLPAQLTEQIIAERPEEVAYAPAAANFFLAINIDKVPDARVREAIRLLIDTRFITNTILHYGIPTSIFTPTHVTDAQKATEAEYFNQDRDTRVKRAQELLKEAGYTPEKPFEFELLRGKGNTLERTAIAMNGWFTKDSGGLIKFTDRVEETKVFYESLNAGRYLARMSGWGADYNQASTFYNTLRCHDTNNTYGYCSEEYDNILKAANTEQDPEKRAELYAKANEVIVKDVAVIPLFWKEVKNAINPNLGGFNPWNLNNYYKNYFIIANKGVKKL